MRTQRREAGFTLMELIIVVALIGILATIVIPNLRTTPIKAKEAVLKADLHTFRDVIDQFFADRGYYPEELQDLVDKGYLRDVPRDPFTESKETWIMIYSDETTQGADVAEARGGKRGIYDVKSGAPGVAMDGSSYHDW